VTRRPREGSLCSQRRAHRTRISAYRGQLQSWSPGETFHHKIDEGADLERQVPAADVDDIQRGFLQRVVGQNRRQRSFERRFFKEDPRQRRQADTGSHGVGHAGRRAVAQDDAERYFNLSVWTCESDRIKIADRDEIMAGKLYMERRGWSPSVWGLGRHRISSALFFYLPSPAGGEAEYGADQDQLDDNWVPREWDAKFGFAQWVQNVPQFWVEGPSWDVGFFDKTVPHPGDIKPRSYNLLGSDESAR